MNLNPESVRAKQERLKELQQEQHDLQAQIRLQQYAAAYQVQLEFPARVVQSSSSSKRNIITTNDELIQHRLLEAGVLYEVPVSLSDTLKTTRRFVADLERTGCFDSVRVQVGGSAEKSSDASRHLNVVLDEANWYRLHAGGGLKMGGLLHPEQASSTSGLPTAEIEASLGLRNLSGYLDTTSLQYAVDTKSIASLSLHHERPLYSVLPPRLREAVLSLPTGSRYAFHAKAAIDTVDYEWTRSYKEFQRMVSLRAANTHNTARGDQAPGIYYALEWMTLLRDVVPRRHAALPYAMDASPEIVSQAGPNVKHCVTAEWRSNGAYMNDPLQPTRGVEFHGQAQVATPPGDVGFVKLHGGLSLHKQLDELLSLLTKHVAIHAAFNTGYLHPLSFGGLCRPPTVSDRFYVGGPMQLRGFGPAGIGPRALASNNTNSSSDNNSKSGGYLDALGGDFYYTATAMASVSPGDLYVQYAENNNSTTNTNNNGTQENNGSPVRLFGFATLGTCVGCVSRTPLWAVAQSSRAAVGVGVATALFGPRLEITWAWPLRYGPRDVTRQFHFGMAFQFE